MTYRDVLRYQPNLVLVNQSRISSRLLKYTKGDVFIAFNRFNDCFELHSVKSYQITGYSQNAVIEQEYINGFIYHDYRASELRKFLYDVQDRRENTERLYSDGDAKRRNYLASSVKAVERVMGTRI